MNSNPTLPVHDLDSLDGLVGQLFAGVSRRRGVRLVGWVLALGVHVGAALLLANQRAQAAIEQQPPPVDVEFVSPPEPPPPPLEPLVQSDVKVAPANASPAPPVAARAGALHLAKADASPAQPSDDAIDFTTDPNGRSYAGGVVAVGGTAAFGASGARAGSPAGNAPRAPVVPRLVAEALTPASDLSRKPQLPGADPCRGFFPVGAEDDMGQVAVIVTINKAGRVQNTQLLSEAPSRQGFGVAARACLASQRFVPALDRAGNSAATAVRVNLRFSR